MEVTGKATALEEEGQGHASTLTEHFEFRAGIVMGRGGLEG